MRDQQKIDSKLITWLDGLRMIGNDAAHDLNAQIDKSDALDSLHFVEAVFMYVFSLNARYDEFQSRRVAKSKWYKHYPKRDPFLRTYDRIKVLL